MNLQKYISSGVLEAYINGLLTDEENRAVDEMVNKHPEVRKELDEIRHALHQFGKVAKGPNPPSLDTILLSVEEGENDRARQSITRDLIARERPSNWKNYLLAAAVVLFLLTSVASLVLMQEVSSLKQEVAAIKTENNYISLQYEKLKKQPEVIMAHDKIIADPASKEISMAGLEVDPGAVVKLYWHDVSKEVYLLIEALPEPPQGHQYQLWAIIDGVSVDAGIFDHHTNMQKLRRVEGNVSAFAVTLEEKGGKPIPNLEQMYAKGKVSL